MREADERKRILWREKKDNKMMKKKRKENDLKNAAEGKE